MVFAFHDTCLSFGEPSSAHRYLETSGDLAGHIRSQVPQAERWNDMGGKKPVRLKSASDAKVKIEVRSKKAKLIIELPERTRRRLLLQLKRLEPRQ